MRTSDPRAGGFYKDQGPEAGYVSRATERSEACIRVCTGTVAIEQRGQVTQGPAG